MQQSTTASDADRITQLCSVLADARRRRAVAALRDATAPMTLEELAAAIDAESPRSSARPDDPEDTTRLELSLYHVHLPKLAAAGLVAYDEAQRRVSFVANDDALDGVLGPLDSAAE